MAVELNERFSWQVCGGDPTFPTPICTSVIGYGDTEQGLRKHQELATEKVNQGQTNVTLQRRRTFWRGKNGKATTEVVSSVDYPLAASATAS